MGMIDLAASIPSCTALTTDASAAQSMQSTMIKRLNKKKEKEEEM